jgi:hypothetical protein
MVMTIPNKPKSLAANAAHPQSCYEGATTWNLGSSSTCGGNSSKVKAEDIMMATANHRLDACHTQNPHSTMYLFQCFSVHELLLQVTNDAEGREPQRIPVSFVMVFPNTVL